MSNIIDKKRYDDCMKHIGQIGAIISLIGELSDISMGDMTEEEYDENIHQASSLLFNAGRILESSANKHIEES